MANILIVDDAHFMRETLRKILENGGHTVIGDAADGHEAIERYKELEPDLVTMDITMPHMNGVDALKEIRKWHQQAKVVVCSATGQQRVVVEAIESGAKDFIVKPFEENRVLETINRIVDDS